MVTPIKVEIEASNSCNGWMCCFGGTPKKKVSPKSEFIVEETTTKVTHVFERHHHPSQTITGDQSGPD